MPPSALTRRATTSGSVGDVSDPVDAFDADVRQGRRASYVKRHALDEPAGSLN
jgi:hypothetical protein